MPKSDALEAFGLWRERTGQPGSDVSQGTEVLKTIDHATLRLLPLLHHQLQMFKVDDPILARMADVYLDSWLLLNRNLSFMLPLLRQLNEKAIDTMLLKGAPVAFEYYPLPATRPMADFDVLIKSADIHMTIEVLAEAGWHPMRELIADDFRFRHAQSFVNSQGVEFDFHWHVMPASCDEHADREFWQRSLTFDLNGVPTRRLDATDCLLHTLVHGVHAVASNAEPTIRWVSDSILILQKDADKVEWDRIVGFATRYRLTHRLALALSYLRDDMCVNIPSTTIEQLESCPVTLLERLEHRPRKATHAKISDYSAFAPKTNLIDKLVQFLRHKNRIAQQHNDESGKSTGFLAFLVYKHRVSSVREIVLIYARKLAFFAKSGLVKNAKK